MAQMKASRGRRNKALIMAGAVAALAPVLRAADTGWNQTAAGPWDYNDPNNWVGGNVTGNWDVSLTLTAGQTITLGADTVLSTGLSFNYTGGQSVTFRGQGADRTLTLGGDITYTPVSTSRTLTLGSATAGQALNIDLGNATRTFTVGSTRTLSIVNVMSNGAIVAAGGNFVFSGANTYTGGTTLNAGILNLSGSAGSAVNSDFVVNTNRLGISTLTFNSSTSGVTGTTRAKSVFLNGFGGTPSSSQAAMLSVTGNAGTNSIDSITNALTAGAGVSIISLTPNAAANTRLTAGSFVRQASGQVLFRGADLGVSTIASQTAGDANITFTTAPTLTGGAGANGTDHGIIAGAWGDNSGSASTTVGLTGGDTAGLVTYDSTYGVRLLTPSQYKSTIDSGQTQLDNVKLSNTGGAGIATTSLSSSATINSLSFNISGTGSNAGITLTGDTGTALVINSGVIYATQTIGGTTTTTNAMLLSVPTIDLNGREGIVLAATNGLTSTRSGGVLEISGSITNDGGNGVTYGGSGVTKLTGSNSYTGASYVNSGILYLSGSTGNAIAGDLVLNGGSVDNAGNRIADTASITINSGTLNLRIGNEGNARSETYTNLTMNGGAYSTGSAGHSGASRIQGFANLAAGSMSIARDTKVTVSGLATLSGTTVTLGSSNSAATTTTVFTANGGLAIVNTASGAYTPFTLGADATTLLGGRLQLNSDLTFTGNATNANTVTIATGINTNLGTVGLTGERTFNIGNGAAASDLTIAAPIVNGGTPGSITKTGLGTLDLQFANSYTGGTTVSEGRVIVGAAANLGTGNVSVAAGAVLELDNNLAIDDAATLTVLSGGTNGTVDLGFAGTEYVASLVLGGVTYGAGIYDATSDGDYFTGGGSITVVPEPSTLGLLTLAGTLGLRRRRRGH